MFSNINSQTDSSESNEQHYYACIIVIWIANDGSVCSKGAIDQGAWCGAGINTNPRKAHYSLNRPIEVVENVVVMFWARDPKSTKSLEAVKKPI
jgi:hypothetical protein